jgi:hypothetical protein
MSVFERGKGKFIRPKEDLAFSAARFIAKGGSYVAYYMWHGGTNFGKWGSAWKTASYDYDAPMNEYGFLTPKFEHLRQLHAVVNDYSDLILGSDPVRLSLGLFTVRIIHINYIKCNDLIMTILGGTYL